MDERIKQVDGRIDYTDDSGKVTSYWHASSVHISASSFTLSRNLIAGKPSELRPVIRASAKLYDRSISIIGAPESRAKEVELSISGRLSAAEQKFVGPVEDFEKGNASMGHSPSDQEFDQLESWWLECHVDQHVLEQLVDHIERGTVASLELAVCCQNVYQDDPPIAPPAYSKQLFLRPSSAGSGWTEAANGEIKMLTIMHSDARRETAPVDDWNRAEPQPVARAAEPLIGGSMQGIDGIKASLEGLRSTIQLVGVFLILMLSVIAWR